MPVVGGPMAPVELESADGRPVRLADYVGDGPLLVVALRYYGCLPCLEFVRSVGAAYDEFQATGASALAVGTAAGYQAQHLMDEGLGFPAVVDPESNLYRTLALPRMRWWEIVKPDGLRNYWRAFRRGGRRGRITGDTLQLPGVAVLDSDGVLRWVHRGRSIGDYPSLDETLREVTAAAGPV